MRSEPITPAESTKRNDFLDGTKGVLILLVTIGHAIQFIHFWGKSTFFDDPWFKAIYIFHMPLFMAVGGYLSYAGIQKRATGVYIRGKIESYALPAFSWTGVYVVCLYLFVEATRSWFSPRIVIPETCRLWFLWVLLIAVVLTALVKRIGRSFWPILSLVFAGVILIPIPPSPIQDVIVQTKYMLPYFLAGYIVAASGSYFLSRDKLVVIGVVAALATVILFPLWNYNTYVYTTGMNLVPGNYENIILRYGAGFATSTFVVLVLCTLFHNCPGRWSLPLRVIGRDSLYIYILQTYLYIIIDRYMTNHRSEPEHRIGFLTTILIGIAVAWICWFIGRMLARHPITALMLFGKSGKRVG
ncbi:MAG: acyltransferase family protein [Verrucomicrobiota bacterium]|nr:acyltransferase family protein [Verrucomicrobiota bacterium]